MHWRMEEIITNETNDISQRRKVRVAIMAAFFHICLISDGICGKRRSDIWKHGSGLHL